MPHKWSAKKLHAALRKIAETPDPHDVLAKQLFDDGVTEAELAAWLRTLRPRDVPIQLGKLSQKTYVHVQIDMRSKFRNVVNDAAQKHRGG
jgi:lysophospholipase L1-like esterase